MRSLGVCVECKQPKDTLLGGQWGGYICEDCHARKLKWPALDRCPEDILKEEIENE